MSKREGVSGQQDAEKHPENTLVSQGAIIGLNASDPFAARMRRSPVGETRASVGRLTAKAHSTLLNAKKRPPRFHAAGA